MEALLEHIKGFGFGFLLGSVIVSFFNLDSSYILYIAFLWVVVVNIYQEFLVEYLKKKNHEAEIAEKLNLLEKKRYVLSVQEYITTKRDLTYEFNNFQGEIILKTIDDCQRKYKLNDSLEESIIKEFEHRIEKLITEKLLINNLFRDDLNLQKVIIGRIMLLFDTNIIAENFGIDNKPSKIQLLETRLDFLSSYDNWKDEKISQIIKITENEKINELLSDKKNINSEIRSIYLKNIEDILEPSRFRMQPDTYLETKQYLINTYNVVNKLNLDLPEIIDEDEIVNECKYRIDFFYKRFVENWIKDKEWLINSESQKNVYNKSTLNEDQITELKIKLESLDIRKEFLEKYVSIPLNNGEQYSFLLENNVNRFLNEKKASINEVFDKFQDEIKDRLDLKVLNKDILLRNNNEGTLNSE